MNKYCQPELSDCLLRTRIIDEFDRVFYRSVIWVSSPPGSGKTTAINSYLNNKDIKALWYQLDERDADPVYFFKTFFQSAKKSQSKPLNELNSVRPNDPKALISSTRNYFEQLYSNMELPFILVFDDHHNLPDNSKVHQVIAIAAEVLPKHGHIIVSSRSKLPPAFSRLQASQVLSIIDNNVLRFTLAETRELTHLLGEEDMSEGIIQALQERYQGWVAGIVLQIKHSTVSVPQDLMHNQVPDALSNYLSEEVFDKLSATEQEILLICALVPQMYDSLVKPLTNNSNCMNILSELYQRGLFISFHFEPVKCFRFQALFRQFLLEKGRQYFTNEMRTELYARAVKLVAALKQYESAIELLREVNKLELTRNFILDNSADMLKQGKLKILQETIACLPDDYNEPWISYWSGRATMAVDLPAARKYFEQALGEFENSADQTGMLLSWAGIIDTFTLFWDDFKPLDHWINWGEEKLHTIDAFDSIEVEARVSFSMFSSLLYRQPQNLEMHKWANRAYRLLDEIPDLNHRILMAAQYVFYLIWMGELEKNAIVIERIQPLQSQQSIHPVTRLAWQLYEAMYYWHSIEFDKSMRVIESGLDLADESGVHVWDFFFLTLKAYVTFNDSDTLIRDKCLDKMRAVMEKNGKLHRAHYYYVAGLDAQLRHDNERALQHVQKSLEASKSMGTPYPEALCNIAMARIQTERSEFKKAQEYLYSANTLAQKMCSSFLKYNCALTHTELSLASGDHAIAINALANAMKIGRQNNYFGTDWWRPDIMLLLYQKALENGIEVQYVQQVILKRKLTPNTPPFQLENWPWKLKVYTLGRFSVVLNGKPLLFESKTQNKPLELLKVLIALGGREVHETHVSEVLWPNAEGDAAHSAFTTTISRLRKLLFKDAVVVQDGHVSLNDHYCWLDTWAFMRQCNELEKLLENYEPQVQAVQQGTEKFFRLYHGSFFSNEPQLSIVLGQRARLKHKFLHIIKRLIDFYNNTNNYEQIIMLNEKALEIDMLSEEYYQGLMECYATLGNSAKALELYDECYALLRAAFNIKPSEKTQKIYQEIKTNHLEELNDVCPSCQK